MQKFKSTPGNDKLLDAFETLCLALNLSIRERFITCRLSKWGILGSVCREDVEVEVDSGQVRMRERVLPSSPSSSPSTVVRLVGDGKLQ